MTSLEPGRAEYPTLSSLWLDGTKRMDPDAWSRLVNAFGPIVYRWCRTAGVRESDAPDVVQEVFAAVARGIGGFERVRPEGSFRSWLATITRNKTRDHFRRAAKHHEAIGGTAALQRLNQHADEVDSTVTLQGMQSPLVRQVLRLVRAEFEPKTWDAFWRTTIDRQSAAEVAAELELSTASVYQAKSRILRRLRQAMAELPE